MYETRGRWYLFIEISLRIVLATIFCITQDAEPFRRKIQPEEMWLYKYPRTRSYVPNIMIWPIIIIVPVCTIYIMNLVLRNKNDKLQAALGLSLTFCINGVATNTMKLIVGRPRPDYFYRCYPDGTEDITLPCTGDKYDIMEGLKSFPSGHSSFVFATMTYSTLYMSGKLHVFTPRGRGESWRLLLSLCPAFLALVIALSRTCDYHHHWQDVLTGSILGVCVGWLCYSQYYPSVCHSNCGLPLTAIPVESNSTNETRKTGNLVEIKTV